MDRIAVFIDAGYLFAQGSVLLTGQKLARGEMELDVKGVLEAVEKLATRLSGLPLLRIYWYDGTGTGPTAQHLAIAYQPRVKLRLGFVNTFGEQKGVDSLIVTDMISLARNRAMADALLLSGDEDIRVGVQQAQEFGVRVHLLGISPSKGSQSVFLLQEADTTTEWTRMDVEPFLKWRQGVVEKVVSEKGIGGESWVAPPGADADMRLVVTDAIAGLGLPEEEIKALILEFEGTGKVLGKADRILLGTAKRRFGRLLDRPAQDSLRKLFIQTLRGI